MSTHKNIDKICVIVLILAIAITVLFMNGEKLGITVIKDYDSEELEGSEYFTENDLNYNWNTSSATTITLSGSSGKISGDGAYFLNGDLVISAAGYYVISGELSDGSIIVDTNKNSKVWILLSGVDLYKSDDSCIEVLEAEKVFLTLKENTTNTLECGDSFSTEALADGRDAVVFSHDDLTINGLGTLVVKANYKHGISANDNLVITSGNIDVTSVGDSIRANDTLNIKDANIKINSSDDGLVLDSTENSMYIESGTFDITTKSDGINSSGYVDIISGDFEISVSDDGIHADSLINISGGNILISNCYEGIEANNINISDGTILIYPTDDGLNANGGTNSFGTMMMGTFGKQMSTDETSSNDFILTSTTQGNGSMPNGTKGGMGAPNSNGGFDSNENGMGGQGEIVPNTGSNTIPGQNDSTLSESSSSDISTITISGGSLTIINENGSDADGIDSNGNIYITGGEVYISLEGTGTNCALDYGSENRGVCEISGGIVIAAGGSSMVEEMSTSSTQASIMYIISGATSDDTSLNVYNEDGENILSYDVPVAFTSIILSTPDITVGNSYTISLGSISEEVEVTSTATKYQSSLSGSSNLNNGFNMGGNIGNAINNGGMTLPSESMEIPNMNNNQSMPGNINESNGIEMPSGNSDSLNASGEITPPNMDNIDMSEMPNGENFDMSEIPSGDSISPNTDGEITIPNMDNSDTEIIDENLDQSEIIEEENIESSDSDLKEELLEVLISIIVITIGILVAYFYKKRC